MLLKAAKVIIPKSIRLDMLKTLHEGILNINRFIAKARLLIFFSRHDCRYPTHYKQVRQMKAIRMLAAS